MIKSFPVISTLSDPRNSVGSWVVSKSSADYIYFANTGAWFGNSSIDTQFHIIDKDSMKIVWSWGQTGGFIDGNKNFVVTTSLTNVVTAQDLLKKELLWNFSLPQDARTSAAAILDITVDDNNNSYVLYSRNDISSVAIQKIDSQGNAVWNIVVPGAGYDQTPWYQITSHGNAVYFSGNGGLKKFDSTGNLLWTAPIQDPETGRSCETFLVQSNGDVIGIGGFPNEGNTQLAGLRISKFSSTSGSVIKTSIFSEKDFGLEGDYTVMYQPHVGGIAEDKNGNIVITSHVYPLKAENHIDIYVAMLDKDFKPKSSAIFFKGGDSSSAGVFVSEDDQSFILTGNAVNSEFQGQYFEGSRNFFVKFLLPPSAVLGTVGNDDLSGTQQGDEIDGLAGADKIQGLEGNDVLAGGAGNDTLNGGTGNDSLAGGTDNDVYVVDVIGDVITEAVSSGTDTVQATAMSYVLGSNLENLTFVGAGGGFSGVGNELANSITGGAGADTLNGGAGNDSLNGGLGNDTYVVDGTGDVINEASGGGIDTVQATSTRYNLTKNLENLAFTGSGNFTGTGNEVANSIVGGGGNDSLSGGVGNDTLNGGTGADTLVGGVGADRFVLAGSDVVSDFNSSLSDSIDASRLSSSDTVTFTVVTGTLAMSTAAASVRANAAQTATIMVTGSGLDSLVGGAAADSLSAGSGNDTLWGGVGNDTLVGGLGDDSLVGGVGNDTYVVDSSSDAIVELTNSGTDQVQATLASYTLSANLENLVFTGTGGFTGTGNDLANSITGGIDADSLSGGLGNDTVNAGTGADTVIGGRGNDSIVLTETVSATDQIVFAGGTGAAGSLDRVRLLGLDTITGFDFGSSSSAIDLLQFNSDDFSLFGSAIRGSSGLDGNFYVVSALPSRKAVDLNGSNVNNTGAAIVFVGASTGNKGVNVYFTANEGSFSTATAVHIATLVGVNTSALDASDIVPFGK